MPRIEEFLSRFTATHADVVAGIVGFVAALALAWVGHAILIRLARRLTARSRSMIDDVVIDSFARPSRLLILSFVALAAAPALPLSDAGLEIVRRGLGLVLIAAFGWMLAGAAQTARGIVEARFDVSVADNLRARRVRTRAGILYRIALAIIAVLILCLMLMSFPSVRHVGLTLFASAGLAGLAIGAAAQPALKNLIAGMQLAFTEPIHLDDVVVIDGEWGRIEEIRLTYVVVRSWDDRRLIVPVSKFLDSSFENWTRQTSAILGTVYLYLDYTVEVDALRTELRAIVGRSAHWDRRACMLQVTDLKERTVELRALVSAANAGAAFDLRCEVREQMLGFIRTAYPEALPRLRAALDREGVEERREVPEAA